MKIIDNRKDFYDFTCSMYDTDDSVVYVRKTHCLKYNITEDKKLIDEFVKNLKLQVQRGYKNITKTEPYQLYIEHLIVGIYPNVYIIPFIVTLEYNKKLVSNYSFNKFLPLPLDMYHDDKKIMDFYFSKFPEEKNRNYTLYTYNSMRKTQWNKDYFVDKFVIENKDLFEKVIKAPTFIYLNDCASMYTDYRYSYLRHVINNEYSKNTIYERARHDFQTTLIINPVFTDYPSNILNPIRDILNNTPIYNDIENFLWAVKQEPIPNVDNNIKIINHGFDLKTSFRKM